MISNVFAQFAEALDGIATGSAGIDESGNLFARALREAARFLTTFGS